MEFIKKNYLTMANNFFASSFIGILAFSIASLLINNNDQYLQIFFIIVTVILTLLFALIIGRFICYIVKPSKYALFLDTEDTSQLNYNVFWIEFKIWFFVVITYIGCYLALQNNNIQSIIGSTIIAIYYFSLLIYLITLFWKRRNMNMDHLDFSPKV